MLMLTVPNNVYGDTKLGLKGTGLFYFEVIIHTDIINISYLMHSEFDMLLCLAQKALIFTRE